MTNIFLYGYYYRYKQFRKQINDLVTSDNFTDARTLIDSTITEHDNYITSRNINNDGNNFTSVDNLSLHHANDHLETAETDPIQKQATIKALNEV